MTKSSIKTVAEAREAVRALLKGSGGSSLGFQDDTLVEAVELLAPSEPTTAQKVARHLWRDGSPGDAFIVELTRQAAQASAFPTAAAVAVRKLRLVRLLTAEWSLSEELVRQIDAALA
jgi:hypothetical protein